MAGHNSSYNSPAQLVKKFLPLVFFAKDELPEKFREFKPDTNSGSGIVCSA